MSKIEIRQRRKSLVLYLSFFLLITLFSGYIAFFTEKYKDDLTSKISLFIGVAIFGYFAYPSVIKLVMNEPIIIMEKDSIVLNTKKTITIWKREIEHMDVTHVNEIGYFLTIKTKDTTHETNISWLDKTPDEIKELIKGYKK